MTSPVGLYEASYEGFRQSARERVRLETYGEDLGQTSWLTADEWRTFIGWLQLEPDAQVLDVACGSGGPALYLARTHGVSVTGAEVNEAAVATATKMALEAGLADRALFLHADAAQPLPFDDDAFDSVVCIDAINHLANRDHVLADWYRLLRPGGHLLFTDPILVTGLLTDEEIATRASLGYFIFALPEEDERLVREAGFRLVRHEDATENMAGVAGRWHDARTKYRNALVADEGIETFEGTQRFLQVARTLASERRLSRHVFLATK
jgi:SAM-dependent methyltransferase